MKALTAKVATLLMLMSSQAVMAEQAIRQSSGTFLDDSLILGDVAVAGERFVGVLIPEDKQLAVLDTLTWELVVSSDTDENSNGLVDVCVLGTDSGRPTTIIPLHEDDGSFVVGCEGGYLSLVTLDRESDSDYASLTVTTVQPEVDGTATDTPFLALASDVNEYNIYAVGSDFYIYVLPISTFDDGTATQVLLGNLDSAPSAIALDRGPSTIPASTVAAVGFEDGSILFYDLVEAKIVGPVSCAGTVPTTGLVGFNSQFLASYESGSDSNSLYAISYASASPGCFVENSDFEGLQSSVQSMSLAESSDDSGTLYALGLNSSEVPTLSSLDVSWSGSLSADNPSDLFTSGLDSEIGSVAASSEEVDYVIHASETTLQIISDKPLVTAELTVDGVSDGSSTDDSDVTPTESLVSSDIDYYELTVELESDEAGTLDITLDGTSVSDLSTEALDSDTLGTTGLHSLELIITEDDLDEGIHELVVSVTDDDGNIGSVTHFFSIEEAPSALANFEGGFGDRKMLLTWDAPSNTSVTHYELVMLVSEIDGEIPYATGADFMTALGALDDSTVSFVAGEVSYPGDVDELDGDGQWPILISEDSVVLYETELLTQVLSYTITPLENRTESGGNQYWASMRAVEIDGTDVREGPWTSFVSAVPESTVGAAELSGETGGFGCGGCGSETTSDATPTWMFLWIVALGGRRLRRRGSTDISE